MLKVQHMAHHFKQKLFADLMEKSPPYKCPVKDCSYKTKHKPDWARHYGSVHQFINKYLNEFMEERQRLGITRKESETFQVRAGGDQAPSQAQQELAPSMNAVAEDTLQTSANGQTPHITDGERTYSAFLPMADLSQIISTAMTQQAQPQKNFGVVTVTGPVVQQIQQQNAAVNPGNLGLPQTTGCP